MPGKNEYLSDDELLATAKPSKVRNEYLSDEELLASGDDNWDAEFAAQAAHAKRTRGIGETINDTVIEGVNSAAGMVGAIGSFIKPGNPVSEGIDSFIKEGEKHQSDVVRADKEKFQSALKKSETIGDDLSAVADYIMSSPLQVTAQAIGSFGPTGIGMKAAKVGTGLMGAGERAATIAARTTGIGMGVAGGGGDAAGDAYKLVQETPDEVLKKHPVVIDLLAKGVPFDQIKDDIATRAARKASILPGIAGGVAGAFGAEKLLAGGAVKDGYKHVLGTSLVEGGTEAIEEGLAHYTGRSAAQQYNPAVDPTKNLAAMTAMGGVMGAGTGAVIAAITPSKPDPTILNTNNIDDALAAANAATAPNANKPPPNPPGSAPVAPRSATDIAQSINDEELLNQLNNRPDNQAYVPQPEAVERPTIDIAPDVQPTDLDSPGGSSPTDAHHERARKWLATLDDAKLQEMSDNEIGWNKAVVDEELERRYPTIQRSPTQRKPIIEQSQTTDLNVSAAQVDQKTQPIEGVTNGTTSQPTNSEVATNPFKEGNPDAEGSDANGVLRHEATIGAGGIGMPGTVVENDGAGGVSPNASNQPSSVDQQKQVIEGDPPLADGMTRLYHGSATHGRYDGPAWFSTEREYAKNYRNGAELQYVDVPTDYINERADPDGYGQTPAKGFTFNIELDSKEFGARKPLASNALPVDRIQPTVNSDLASTTTADNKIAASLKRKSFAELGELSNDAQKLVDARHAELDDQGVSWEDQKKDAKLNNFYEKRFVFDTAAAQKAYDSAKEIVDRYTKGLPFDSFMHGDVDSILRKAYGLDNGFYGSYSLSKLGDKFDSQKTVEYVTNVIRAAIFKKTHPNADYDTSMTSNISGLTFKEQTRILKEGREIAQKIHNELRNLFIQDAVQQSPSTPLPASAPQGDVQTSQPAQEPKPQPESKPAEDVSQQENINLEDLNSGRAFVNGIKKKIAEWVASATQNGKRPLDRNWERNAVKRFTDTYVNPTLSGKQYGNRAASKIAVAKSETFAELEAAIEKFVNKTESANKAPKEKPLSEMSPADLLRAAAAKMDAESKPVDAPKFVRRGDFWNYSGNRVAEIAKVLDLTVTSRDGIKSVGIPDYARDNMERQLRDAGINAEFEADVYKKSENVDTSKERVQKEDKSVHDSVQDEPASIEDIGLKLQNKIYRNYEEAVREYNALNDEKLDITSSNGAILDTDLARELSPDYRKDRARASDVHDAASAFIKRMYADRLSKPTPEGKLPTVVFTAGGTGAGKSTSLKMARIRPFVENAEIVYDTSMSKLASAVSKINLALDNGRDVHIVYTYRDVTDAFINGSLPRAQEIGRTVPVDDHIRTHVEASKIVRELATIYADIPRVTFSYIDNSHGKRGAKEVELTDLPLVSDNKLKEKLNEELARKHQSGGISDSIFHATQNTRNTKETGRIPQGVGASVGGKPKSAHQQNLNDAPLASVAKKSDISSYEIQPDSARNLPIDAAELTALRRAAASVESPERGITFTVSADGKAIVTGPARVKVPARFQRFANEHELTLVVQRADTKGFANSNAAMPLEYRESGALYFGEMGADHLDRTGKTRFSKAAEPKAAPQTVESITKATAKLRASWLGFKKINIIQSVKAVPTELYLRSLRAGAAIDSGTEGIYDPKTNTVYLIADNIASPERSVWVALHEVVGHGGIRMLGAPVAKSLNLAAKNVFVTNLANAIAADREEVFNALTHTDEAIAELAAATITGNVDAILERYGVKVPIGMRSNLLGMIKRVVDAVRSFVSRVTGKHIEGVSDGEVLGLIRRMKDAVEGSASEYNAERESQGVLASVGGQQSLGYGDKPIEASRPVTVPAETPMQGRQRVVQDKFNRFKVLQDWLKSNGMDLSEQADVYLAETLMSGRVSSRTQDFRENQMAPLIKKTQKAGISMEQIGDFLKMQHAPEANERARLLHDDPKATAFGVSDKEAREAMATYEARPDFKELKAIADEWRDVTTQSRKILLDGGIISPEMARSWEDTYSVYIPVKGAKDETGTGKGLSVNGRQKARLGHGLRDEAILENIWRDHERAISLDEKNLVGKALIRFALEAQNDDIITVSKPEKRQVLKTGGHSYMVILRNNDVAAFDNEIEAERYILNEISKGFAHGLNRSDFSTAKTNNPARVMMQASPLLADNEVNVYVGGHAVRVQINDEIAARAYTNLGVEHLNAVLSAGRSFNNWLSKAFTGWNPNFILTNPIRDALQGSATLTANYGAGMAAKIFANYPMAVKELFKHFRKPGSSPLVTDYRANGGSTGAAYLSDLERIGSDMQDAYNEYAGVFNTYHRTYAKAISEGRSKTAAHTIASLKSGAAGVKKVPVIGHFLRLMERINAITENALRVATYHTLVKNKVSKPRAAAQAKNLMNFNRKGEISNQAGALYLFFNPNVQGSQVMYQSLFEAKHKGQARTLAGMMVLSAFAIAAMNRGDDDEEKWKSTPDYVKDGNIVIKIPGSDYQVTLTLPYGYRVFHMLGNVLSDYVHGEDGYKLGIRMASGVFANFSPVGNPMEGEHFPFQVMPTVAKMALGPGLNENSFGQSIAPQRFNDAKPDSQLMFRSTKGGVYASTAEKLNELSGGTKYRPGNIDVSPETLKFWVSSLTGGAGQAAVDILSLPRKLTSEASTPVREMPVIKRFVREVGISDKRAAFWDKAEEAKKAANEFGEAMRHRDAKAMPGIIDKNIALIALSKYADAQQKLITLKRDEVDRIRNDDTLSPLQKEMQTRKVEREEEKVYSDFIKKFEVDTKAMKEKEAAMH